MRDLADLKPQSCKAVSLECDSCTRASARATAKVCRSMTASLIENTFFKMYPDAACGGQLAHFAQVYFEATEAISVPGPRLVTVAA